MSVTKVTGMMQTGTKGGDIPSASTLVIDTYGDYFDIPGTTGITAMTVDAGRRFTLQFDGAVTLTHGSSLYLPGAVNFTTEANDCLSFIATAANTVRCTGYALKDGGSPVAPAGGFTLGTRLATTSGTTQTFSSIPSGTKVIHIGLNGVSCTGAWVPTWKLGDSGGLETSGYLNVASSITSSTVQGSSAVTSAWGWRNLGSGGDALYGQASLVLEDATTNTWSMSFITRFGSTETMWGAGTKALSAELTTLELSGGTFDAGTMNISYL